MPSERDSEDSAHAAPPSLCIFVYAIGVGPVVVIGSEPAQLVAYKGPDVLPLIGRAITLLCHFNHSNSGANYFFYSLGGVTVCVLIA